MNDLAEFGRSSPSDGVNNENANYDLLAEHGLDGADWLLTREDLEEFDRTLDLKERAFALYCLVCDTICDVDVDGDGYLSKAEIDKAISESTTDQDRQMWEMLRTKYDEISSITDDGGLSLEDVLAYAAYAAMGPEKYKLLSYVRGDLINTVVCL